MHRRPLLAAATAAFVLVACSDGDPAGPASNGAAAVAAAAGSGQTAVPGGPVAVAPAVLVTDDAGGALPGVEVRFTVTRGGGTLGRTQVSTGADGIASAGTWTLGTAGVNEVEAAVGSLRPVVFTATAAEPNPVAPSGASGSYDIVVRYIGAATTRQRQAVSNAVSRWRTVITTDLPSVPLNAPAGACFDAQPAIAEPVDDLLLYVDFTAIDGAGKVLGEAGPCYVRSGTSLPVVGYLKLDAGDLRQMESGGTLDDVVLHEIGHVLGLGTLWDGAALVTGAGSDDPRYTGARGIAEYRALGGTDAAVPVENTGTEGTRDGHWRESVFGNELMTGYIGGVPNPLSRLTIASLQDLGYGALSAAASGYAIGGGSRGVVEPIDLRGRERPKPPKFEVDARGRVGPWSRHGPRTR